GEQRVRGGQSFGRLDLGAAGTGADMPNAKILRGSNHAGRELPLPLPHSGAGPVIGGAYARCAYGNETNQDRRPDAIHESFRFLKRVYSHPLRANIVPSPVPGLMQIIS